MMFLIWILVLFKCGIGFAYYLSICRTMKSNTLHWHLAQWLPIFTGAVVFLTAGFNTGVNFDLHTPYWVFGRFASLIAVAGIGYVVGREFFFKAGGDE